MRKAVVVTLGIPAFMFALAAPASANDAKGSDSVGKYVLTSLSDGLEQGLGFHVDPREADHIRVTQTSTSF